MSKSNPEDIKSSKASISGNKEEVVHSLSYLKSAMKEFVSCVTHRAHLLVTKQSSANATQTDPEEMECPRIFITDIKEELVLSPSLTYLQSASEEFGTSLIHRAQVLAAKTDYITDINLKRGVQNVAEALNDVCDAYESLFSDVMFDSPQIISLLVRTPREERDERVDSLHFVTPEIQDVADSLKAVAGSIRRLASRVRDLSEAIVEDEMMDEVLDRMQDEIDEMNEEDVSRVDEEDPGMMPEDLKGRDKVVEAQDAANVMKSASEETLKTTTIDDKKKTISKDTLNENEDGEKPPEASSKVSERPRIEDNDCS